MNNYWLDKKKFKDIDKCVFEKIKNFSSDELYLLKLKKLHELKMEIKLRNPQVLGVTIS